MAEFATYEELMQAAKLQLVAQFGPHEAAIAAEYGQETYDQLVDNTLTREQTLDIHKFVHALP